MKPRYKIILIAFCVLVVTYASIIGVALGVDEIPNPASFLYFPGVVIQLIANEGNGIICVDACGPCSAWGPWHILVDGECVLPDNISKHDVITVEKSNNSNCSSINDVEKITDFDLKLPNYLPSNYIFVVCQGTPFEAQIMYHDKNLISDNDKTLIGDPKLVENGAIYLYVLSEKDFVGEEQFQDGIGNTTAYILETIEEVNKKNPSLNLKQVNIQGNVGWANDICDSCGKQTANFPNNTIVQLTPTPARIKFYDENGILYYFQSNMPLSELVKVANSLGTHQPYE